MRQAVATQVILCLCFMGSLVVSAGAQDAVNFGSVSGRVTDAQGAVVPGVQVMARHIETNLTREVATDSEGRFRIPYLKVGSYEFIARLQGFADATRLLTLTVGSAFEIPFSLSVAGLDTVVTVTGDATVLETARSQIAGTVSRVEAQNVPLNGRNFLDLALLVPGVSPTNVGSNQLFAETSAVAGQGISVGSQRNMSNNFIVDGLSANDDAAGLAGMPYSVDAVDQFQVVTSGGQAELGRALGGYISVVTKSGTNLVRGDLYGYFRDRRFNASNPLSGTKLPMNQKQWGMSIGGPIRENRTFFFSNFEQRLLDQTGLATISPESLGVINARLGAVGYSGSIIATGIYPNPVHTNNFLAKLDHQFSGRDQFTARYSRYGVTSSNSRGAGGLNAPSASAGLENTEQGLAISNTLTLSSRTVNETRAQIFHGDLKAPPTDSIGPAVSIAGVASFGTLSGSPTGRVNDMFQIVNNLSRQTGAHALRVGIDFLYNDDRITYPRSVRGSYAFSSLPSFLSGVYNNAGYTQTFGVTEVSQTNPNVGIYGQDEWKVNSELTINAGVRYDLQFLETINTDSNNVSPRLGFAWSPSAARHTIVRGGGGLFFDRIPLRAVANALLSAGNTTDLDQLRQISVSLSPTQNGAPTFPNTLNAFVPAVTLVNLTTMDRNIQNAYSRQGNIEIEQQLKDGSTLSVGYQYVRGMHLIMSVNQNVPACVAAGTNNGCRPNSTYGNNSQYSSVAESDYNGLHISYVQLPMRWANYRVSYTYSRSMNNVGENFFSSPIDPFDLSKDWGRSDDDQRHRLVLNGAVHTPSTPGTSPWEQFSHGFQVSAMVQYYSALPFNITSGVTTVQGTTGRPVVNGQFIERNTGVGSDFLGVNARVSRTFKVARRAQVEGSAEAFNLTNRRNNLTRNGNFGAGPYPASPSAAFGQITAVNDPRSLQFALRLKF